MAMLIFVNIQPSYNSTRQVLYQVCALWSDMHNSIYVIINYKEKSLKINTIMSLINITFASVIRKPIDLRVFIMKAIS